MKHRDSGRELLEKKYEELLGMCSTSLSGGSNQNIYPVVRESIRRFMERCSNPAIWCYGDHTKMLMADFIFELKKVHYIVDHALAGSEEGGFEIIDGDKIAEKAIDGIVISSWRYRHEIVDELKHNYSQIPYLDIYEELEKAGIPVEATYYEATHPYARYRRLNRLQRRVMQEKEQNARRAGLREIIETYIGIKDFQSAISWTEKLCAMSGGTWEREALERLSELSVLHKKALAQIDENNVVMLCIDGLRRKEVTERYMPNLWGYLKHNTYNYRNAYALSTSTYESLIPAYSENTDLRTEYYKSNIVPKGKCRFINEAKRQNRHIYFYTDGTGYVDDEAIRVTTKWQTAAERMWDFTLDIAQETNGLFYLHMLYESHYSYPNPYTEAEIIAEGTSIFFDYLDKNGGEIRTDYDRQQKDALRYLDDVIVPLIGQLPCRLVLYADHGNVLLGRDTVLEGIEETAYTFAEDLLQVPLAIRCPEMGVGEERSQISLLELNNIIISLLNRKSYHYQKKSVIKALRSEIYNPDFRFLYKKTGNGRGLLAFEVFIFEEGCKLAVFADGSVGLYETQTDRKIADRQKKESLLERIQGEITVCDSTSLSLEWETLSALISGLLHVEKEEIGNVSVLKKGMTNRSFLFTWKDRKYIIRIPGEGTEQLINRREEAAVYHAIKGKNICDEIVYLNAENGCKITVFFEQARTCDPYSVSDIGLCMKKLREFHDMKLQVKHEFDIFRQIEFYERLRKGPSVHEDYDRTKKQVLSLKHYIDRHAGRKTLSHIDAVPDNFLFINNDGEQDTIRLIDWEYAGMQDPHVDIAMFCVYSVYSREEIDRLIDLYFTEGCTHETRVKVYCYIAACGLLWSNWCEYKKSLGVEFGEYSCYQYRYAKDYCAVAEDEFIRLGIR